MSSVPGHVAWDIHLDAASHVAFVDVPLWVLFESRLPPGVALPGLAWSGEQWRADTARIVRDPHDMAAHARRVLLQCHEPTGGAMPAEAAERARRLFSALVDLFLALGPHGPELRASLLTRARPRLPAEQHAYLARHLAGGLDRFAPLPGDVHAALAAGARGRFDLVAVQQVAAPRKPALEQAIDLVDRGDAPAAQALLEAALLEDPADVEVADELGQLYRLNAADTQAADMARRLRERGHAVPGSWPVA